MSGKKRSKINEKGGQLELKMKDTKCLDGMADSAKLRYTALHSSVCTKITQ